MPDNLALEPAPITRRHLLRRLAAAGLVPALPHATGAAAGRDAWRIRVRGRVQHPLELSLVDLRHLGGERLSAVLECGDGGAARMGSWTGVPLRAVLDRAGIAPDAGAVIAAGDDGHRRAFSLRDIASAAPLIAWEQDGTALPAPRLLVPGWAGEASVKRVAALEVVDRIPVEPAAVDPADRRLRPLRELPPRAVIVSPVDGGAVAAGWRPIRGYAWSGYAPVTSVAISADGGAMWREAEIVARTGPRGWVEFRCAWDAAPGEARLAARATDAFGLSQPFDVPDRVGGFVHNAIAVVSVAVR